MCPGMNDGNESAFTVNYSTPTAIRMSLISASRVKSALRPADIVDVPLGNEAILRATGRLSERESRGLYPKG